MQENHNIKNVLFLGIPLERKCGVSKVQLELSDALRGQGVNVDHLSAWPGKNMHIFDSQIHGRRSFEGLDEFLGFSRETGLQYDVLHSHSWAWAPTSSPDGKGAADLKRRFNAGLVHLFHSYLPEEEAAQEDLFRFADKIIHLTPQGRDTFCEIFRNARQYADRLEVVPNLVTVKNIHPQRVEEIEYEFDSSKGNFILYVGRIAEEKGTRELAQAYPLIEKAHPRTRIVFLGHGKDDEEIEIMNKSLGKDNPNVTFKGWVDEDTVAAYQEFTRRAGGIQFTPSHYESFSLATAKALARGCNTAISNIPTLRGIYQLDGSLPFGVSISTVTPEAIAEAYDFFAHNPERVAEMTERGKIAMNRDYSPAVVAQKYLNVYAKVA